MCNQLLFHSTYDSKWRIFESSDCLLDEGNNLKTSLCAPGNFNEQFFHFIDIFETKSIMKIMVSCSTIMKKMKRITSYIFVLICNRSALQGWVHYITKGRCTAHRHPSGHNANTKHSHIPANGAFLPTDDNFLAFSKPSSAAPAQHPHKYHRAWLLHEQRINNTLIYSDFFPFIRHLSLQKSFFSATEKHASFWCNSIDTVLKVRHRATRFRRLSTEAVRSLLTNIMKKLP